jgi:hypothetical protein
MKLTASSRKKIANKNFALGGRKFPIQDVSHGREALEDAPKSENAGNITPSQVSTIQSKVHAKFPGIGKKKRIGDRMKGGR